MEDVTLAGYQKPLTWELCALAALRKLPPSCFDLAGRLGTLRTGTYRGTPAWLITDQSLYCAEARRLDGELWSGGRKSLALPGSKKNCPVGLLTLNPALDRLKDIVLVEGGPDYFAALELMIDAPCNFRVATMLGSACSIEFDPAFQCGMASADLRGSRILIIPHNDPAGIKAARKWSADLYGLEASAVAIQPLPDTFKDLNEFMSTDQQGIQCLIEAVSHQFRKDHAHEQRPSNRNASSWEPPSSILPNKP